MAVRKQLPARKAKTKLKGSMSGAEILTGQKALFLTAFGESGNVTFACEIAGIARTQYNNWMADEDFRTKREEALQRALEILEQEARRRAIEGVAKRKFWQGREIRIKDDTKGGKLVPYIEREYSDLLTIFLLKAADPKKYCDAARAAQTGSPDAAVDGAALNVLVRTVSDQLRADPEYIEFLRWKAIKEDKAATTVETAMPSKDDG